MYILRQKSFPASVKWKMRTQKKRRRMRKEKGTRRRSRENKSTSERSREEKKEEEGGTNFCLTPYIQYNLCLHLTRIFFGALILIKVYFFVVNFHKRSKYAVFTIGL